MLRRGTPHVTVIPVWHNRDGRCEDPGLNSDAVHKYTVQPCAKMKRAGARPKIMAWMDGLVRKVRSAIALVVPNPVVNGGPPNQQLFSSGRSSAISASTLASMLNVESHHRLLAVSLKAWLHGCPPTKRFAAGGIEPSRHSPEATCTIGPAVPGAGKRSPLSAVPHGRSSVSEPLRYWPGRGARTPTQSSDGPVWSASPSPAGAVAAAVEMEVRRPVANHWDWFAHGTVRMLTPAAIGPAGRGGWHHGQAIEGSAARQPSPSVAGIETCAPPCHAEVSATGLRPGVAPPCCSIYTRFEAWEDTI